MTEMEQRAAVVAEARGWIGTPFHHSADVKGAGIDCAMLLVRSVVDSGLVPPFDPRPYERFWHMHQNEERYIAWLEKYAHPVATPKSGDIVILRYGKTFSHAGIVAEWPLVIHAYAVDGFVVESDMSLQGPLSDPRYPHKFYSFWNWHE